MDDFKAMAEVKMRESIESKVQSEIDADEARLAQQQEEFDELKSQDSRAEKRQSWLQAISGQGTQTQQPQMGIDPSALGARPSSLGATAGRQPRGAMAQAAAQHTPSMGLAGMRAPRSAAKALSGAQPLARPVKSPIGGAAPAAGRPVVRLPQPIQPKVVRQPIVKSPIQEAPVVESPSIASPVIAPSVVKTPQVQVPSPVSTPKIERIKPKLEIEQRPETPEVEESPEPIVEAEPQPIIEEVETTIPEPVIETEKVETQEPIEEKVETILEEVEEVQKTATLTPIKKLSAVEERKTAVLKPVTMKVLTPKKRRGPPPSSAPGIKPGTQAKVKPTTVLRPVTKLTPVKPSETKDDED